MTSVLKELAATQEPTSGPAEQRRLLRTILERRGQAGFREALLAAYGRRCALTGCDAADALEAAHIVPVSVGGGFTAGDGVLLRADVHTLFDLHLIGIDPASSSVALAPALSSTSYTALSGAPVRPTATPDAAPRIELLQRRWQLFLAANA